MLEKEKLIGISELRDLINEKLGYKPHPFSVQRAIKRGMPCVPDRMRGRGFRFYWSDVDAWLSEPGDVKKEEVVPTRRPGRPSKTGMR